MKRKLKPCPCGKEVTDEHITIYDDYPFGGTISCGCGWSFSGAYDSKKENIKGKLIKGWNRRKGIEQ